MNGELDYDDILHFPEEIVVEKIDDFYLVIAVQTANWIVLYNSRQIDFLNMLRSGKCVGDAIETVDSEEAMGDLKIVLAAIFARKFAGVNGEVTKEYLEGYKMLNIYITNACNQYFVNFQFIDSFIIYYVVYTAPLTGTCTPIRQP